MAGLNKWGQTREWEDACIQTRRDPEKRKRRLSIFKIRKTDKVLDLGCGDGLNTVALIQMGVKNIVGVDISKTLLKEAKKLNPKAKFVLASAEKLPFKSKSFDVVLVDSVFHHLMKYEKSLGEIKRILKDKGKLCFIEPHQSFFRKMLDRVSESSFAKFIPYINKRSASYLGEIKFMKHWLATEEDFYAILRNLGFKELIYRKDILSIVGKYQKS